VALARTRLRFCCSNLQLPISPASTFLKQVVARTAALRRHRHYGQRLDQRRVEAMREGAADFLGQAVCAGATVRHDRACAERRDLKRIVGTMPAPPTGRHFAASSAIAGRTRVYRIIDIRRRPPRHRSSSPAKAVRQGTAAEAIHQRGRRAVNRSSRSIARPCPRI